MVRLKEAKVSVHIYPSGIVPTGSRGAGHARADDNDFRVFIHLTGSQHR
jgi:hypothetical protein